MDEILGPINEVYFTIKMDPGMVATSFKPDDKVYIGGDKLLPIERFLPKPKAASRGELRASSASVCGGKLPARLGETSGNKADVMRVEAHSPSTRSLTQHYQHVD